MGRRPRRSDRERNRLPTLRRVDDAHIDLLAFGEMRNAGRSQDRDMDEDVLAAVLARHEAETLDVVEPLDFAGDGDRGRGVRGDPARPRRIGERALRALSHARRVDFEHASHLRALGAGADLNFEFRARGNRFVTGVMQRVGVQEGVALTAGQLDEAVALVGLEPFDDRV